MEKYTIDEKELLLEAMDTHLTMVEMARSVLHDNGNENGNVIAPALMKITDLRAKLILDISPITVGSLPNTNADASVCCLCKTHFHLHYPDQAMINGYGDVCDKCFEKYEPELYSAVNTKISLQWGVDHAEMF